MNSDYIKDIPFSDIESSGIRYLFHTDLFLCTWQLGIFCNYSCSYCWPDAHSSKPDYKSLALLTQTLDNIKNYARQKGFNSFRFSFVGGEPALQKNFLELIHHYSKDTKNCNYQDIHVTTNLSRNMKWLQMFTEAIRPLDDYVISASFHKEFTNREEFADKVSFLQEQGVFCIINIVMVPEKFYELLEDAQYFYDLSINVQLQTQTDFKSNPVTGYTQKMLTELQTAFPYIKETQEKKTISTQPKRALNVKNRHLMELNDSKGGIWHLDNPNRLNALNFNRYEGWECSAGYRSLVINGNGEIKRGHACYDKPLGHIKTNFTMPSEIAPCISPICTCTSDSKLPKRKVGTKHLLFKTSPDPV